ncbi:flagellar hook-associated protein 2 [Calidifontibacillus erzurumensis]|uniref:Flagellar hook-associated protein 2 n=1 Tax=Calidifontibacillus erzurumensis TaxID=2741433 RepID=A0A8J8GDS2_9BACI|nr:flagellar hook-associated protein 2 [Calidifontibacillus erzurumensis]NSL51797.1 flagellar hook-associated protein 2 [Calidifontibacillus erzurumensis]
MSTMRIGGLASGMDIDSIVKDLMKVERMPLEKLKQKKQILEWQRDDYREMNKLLKELDDLIFDGIFRQSTYLKKTVSVSDETKLTAKAVNVPANLSLQLEVEKLATAASWSSSDPNYSINKDFAINEAKELTFSVLDPGADKEREVKISFSEGDTLDDVITKFNKSSLGVTAFKIDTGSGNVKLVFTNNKTGSGAVIKAKNDDTMTFMNEILGFRFETEQNEYTLIPDQNEEELDAKIKINGYEITQKSNEFTFNGINITLKNVTTSPVTISTSTDVDAILDTIVQFVDKYNKVIEIINGKITQDRYRSYHPLSDEEKEAMTEKQIEMWEEKAKSGLLRNDSILFSGLNQMRVDLYSKVLGASLSQLAEIGIKTSSNYLERGKLIIDEGKLREKIAEDPDAIYKLFNQDGDSYESKGIARRMRETISNTIKKIEEKAGNALRTNQQFVIGRDLLDIEKSIDRFEDRLLKIEDRYWRQFTAMEKAIQKANSQTMYLMQQFNFGY